MNERIKKIRKQLDMTQQDFAEKIGTTQNVVANWESGRRNPSAAAANNICKTFNVNEEWLRTGEGEMFNKMDAADIARQHFNQVMKNASKQKKAVLSAMIEMMFYFPDDKWDYVYEQFKKCLDEAEVVPRPETQPSIDEKVEVYRRALELEKKATEKSEVS